MLGCPPTSITSIRCRSTISTTWPLRGCTTSLETMPQHKWWAPTSSAQSLCLREILISSILGWPASFLVSDCCCRADASFFYLSSSRLSMRSETTHIPSCTCWLCRVSTPPATRLLLERATRFVLLLLYPQLTHQSTRIYHCFLCDQRSGHAWVCNWLSNFQLLQVPDASKSPAAFNLITFVFIWTRCNCFSASFLLLKRLLHFNIYYANVSFVGLCLQANTAMPLKKNKTFHLKDMSICVFPLKELLQLEDRLGSVNRGAVQTTIERFTFPHKYKKVKWLFFS